MIAVQFILCSKAIDSVCMKAHVFCQGKQTSRVESVSVECCLQLHIKFIIRDFVYAFDLCLARVELQKRLLAFGNGNRSLIAALNHKKMPGDFSLFFLEDQCVFLEFFEVGELSHRDVKQ